MRGEWRRREPRMQSRDAGTKDAVARLLPRLTPAAVLLTDDADAAVRLLCAALSRPRALGDPDSALRELAQAAVRRPRWAADQVIESLDPEIPADEDLSMAHAWRAVDVGDRALIVLHRIAALPATDLGSDPSAAEAALRKDLARRDEVERRELSRAAELYRRPGSAPAFEPPPGEVAERLAGLAAGRRLPESAAETISAAIDAGRRARRGRRLGLAAGVLITAVLVGLIPLVPRGAATPRPANVFAGPTRGSLAGDGEFLKAVSNSGWAQAASTPGPRRVVFAGDVPGGRWALVAVGESSSRPATTAWFTGPAGASPDRMSLLSIRVAPDPAEPVSVTDPATGALVVVGAPGDRIRVSDRPEVDAGGTLHRRFRDVATSRGVAVVGLAPVPGATASAVGLQAARQGRLVDVPPPTVVGVPGTPQVVVTPTRLRPAPPPVPGDAAVEPRLRAVLGQLGEPVASTPVTTLWAGDLPGPNDQPARLTVLAIPQPSGAVVVTTPYGYAADRAGGMGSSWCGTGVLPAGILLAQRVVAVQCDLSDLAADPEISRFLVVVGPPRATSIRLLDDSGAVLRELPPADGVAVVRSPGRVAQVDVTMADGGTSSTIPLADADLGR